MEPEVMECSEVECLRTVSEYLRRGTRLLTCYRMYQCLHEDSFIL